MARRRRQREELQRLFTEQIKQRERAIAEEADKAAVVDEAMARRARQEIQEEKADRSKVRWCELEFYSPYLYLF